MTSKHVVIVGAGPCGLAALKEMLEAGHTAVALDKAPGIGGVFRGEDDPTYDNLYLTISSYLMAFSDFPPLDPRIKYSSKQEYQAYLEAYADVFELRPHIRLRTEVVRASREGDRWRIEIRSEGWARPHQGGIPPCAEILSRYLAMILAGTRRLPVDHAERAATEGADEHAFYVNDQHSPNLVDYPAFMDSVARLIGCLPAPPKLPALQRLVQYWAYPNWPLWYRMRGPGARPDVVEAVLSSLPLRTSYAPNPFNLMALAFSLMQLPLDAVRRPHTGLRGRWAFKTKKHLLHGNA